MHSQSIATAPSISVIIPTFNRSGLICRAIDNVFQQTYRDFELIIVDDGSTDDTQSKLKQYGNRIRLLTQENAGPAVARNRGAQVARGEIIAFQDSDDTWHPTKLERQVALLQRLGNSVPCCLCNADMEIIDGKSQTAFDYSLIRPKHKEGLWLNVGEVLATRFVLFNQSVAIRRSAFEKVGGFDVALRYLEDYDLPLRLSFEGPWAFIKDPLVIYSGPSAGSYSQKALNDLVTLRQCELEIYRRTLGLTGRRERYAKMQAYLKRRARRCRRQIRELDLSRLPCTRPIVALMEILDHYEEAAFRRLPWFPKMLTVPVDAASY
jgi:glycosyltransferase involved in cell wall biosynthesis